MLNRITVRVASAFTLAMLSTAAQGIVITYTATDLADASPGVDLWQYDYQVSDHTFGVDESFSIFFDPSVYSNLQDPPGAVNSDWDLLVIQPDQFLPDDGFYDALALVPNPSLDDAFSLTFVHLGAGTPGPQPYQLFDSAFSSIGSGVTVQNSSTAIPVPSTLLIFIGALGGLVCRKATPSIRKEKSKA